MLNLSNERNQHLFIVRLWCEKDHLTEQNHWRGMVLHQGTQQTRHFTRLQDLTAYISMLSGLESNAQSQLESSDGSNHLASQ